MEVICISAKNPRTPEFYREITVGKKYKMIERVGGSQIRIWNDRNEPINYPSACFNISRRTSKGVKVCEKCHKKFIWHGNKCRRCSSIQ